MMIETNPLNGSWCVRQVEVTNGRTSRVIIDAFETFEEALEDASERQAKLARNHLIIWHNDHRGTVFTNLDQPNDHIIIGVTKTDQSAIVIGGVWA